MRKLRKEFDCKPHLQCIEIILRVTVAQAVERVETFKFGAKVVPPVTIVYPIDFFPLPEDAI